MGEVCVGEVWVGEVGEPSKCPRSPILVSEGGEVVVGVVGQDRYVRRSTDRYTLVLKACGSFEFG